MKNCTTITAARECRHWNLTNVIYFHKAELELLNPKHSCFLEVGQIQISVHVYKLKVTYMTWNSFIRYKQYTYIFYASPSVHKVTDYLSPLFLLELQSNFVSGRLACGSQELALHHSLFLLW